MAASLTDFRRQIDELNDRRMQQGLTPLPRDPAIRETIGVWNSLLRGAKEELRERAGRNLGHVLADNAMTHWILVREVEPRFRAYLTFLEIVPQEQKER